MDNKSLLKLVKLYIQNGGNRDNGDDVEDEDEDHFEVDDEEVVIPFGDPSEDACEQLNTELHMQ